MKRKLLATVIAAVWLAPVSAASAAPTGTSHCPAPVSGYISWDTSAEPYQVDNAVDHNGNGTVCAKPTKYTFEEGGTTYVIYNFIDDVLR